ncbi:hypothetical protein BXU06_11245 [Aquaspirillum sp. LM1]|nr:hypothetical protein BXU06_11245 [Aquaspirillum sp. LM1]
MLDIKSASVDVLSILLRSADPAQIHHELGSRLARRPKTFAGEPFLLDLSNLDEGVMNTLPELYRILHEQGVRIIGVRHAHPSVGEQAQALGWNWFPAKLERPPAPAPVTTQAPAPAVAEVSPAPAEPTPVADTSPATPDSPCCKTLVIDRPVRAGQQVYARDGDLVVLAAVSSGAELIADGNIHIYAPMRGRALAGARGNASARIFAQQLSAELVSVAGVYRTLEDELPPTLRGRAVQIFLDGSKLVLAPLGA